MAINVANFERQTTILQNTNTILDELAQGVGKTPSRQIFTSNGSWTAPPGVTKIFVTGGGGGGGGGYASNENVAGSGGITSFGSLLSISGGGGGSGSSVLTNANCGIAGGPGGESGGFLVHSTTGGIQTVGDGGSVALFKGGRSFVDGTVSRKGYKNGGYCCGGGATGINGSAGAGGSGDFVMNHPLSVTPGTTYSITIGAGGAGIATTSAVSAGDGGPGILIIDWWE